MESCCCSAVTVEAKVVCPVCCREGQKVSNITVESLLMSKQYYVEGNSYCICLNPDCMVAYYDNENNTICESSLKVPIWFKNGAKPQYACYCSKVTVDDVIRAVVKGARDVKAVSELTGAMKNSDCIRNNPSGKCCHNEIQRIINSVI